MSTCPGTTLEDFLQDMYSLYQPTDEDIQQIATIWNDYRDYIENKLSQFWEQESGWRSYRDRFCSDSIIPESIWDESKAYFNRT